MFSKIYPSSRFSSLKRAHHAATVHAAAAIKLSITKLISCKDQLSTAKPIFKPIKTCQNVVSLMFHLRPNKSQQHTIHS